MMDAPRTTSEDSYSFAMKRAGEHIRDRISHLLGAGHRFVSTPETPVTVAARVDPMIDIGTPEELRSLAAGAPERLAQQTGSIHDQAELKEKQQIKLLLQTHLEESMWSELLSHVRPAAARGESVLQLLRFPSDLCTDGGRKIRVGEEGWQDTLQGEAAELQARWKRDLSLKGFGLAAWTLEYQEDMPGDIGLFLTWHG